MEFGSQFRIVGVVLAGFCSSMLECIQMNCQRESPKYLVNQFLILGQLSNFAAKYMVECVQFHEFILKSV